VRWQGWCCSPRVLVPCCVTEGEDMKRLIGFLLFVWGVLAGGMFLGGLL
jgi:hypothetical protein